MIEIAFSSTREGCSPFQLDRLHELLKTCVKPRSDSDQRLNCGFHHGDCFGGDVGGHVTARNLGCDIHIHPPCNTRLRAYCQNAVRVWDPLPYLDRNRIMVYSTQWLIAAPLTDFAMTRSGTWSTIRYAHQHRQKYDGAYRITHIKRNGDICEL